MKLLITGIGAVFGYVVGVAFGVLAGTVIDAHFPLTFAPHIATPTGLCTALLFALFIDRLYLEHEERITCFVEERFTLASTSEFFVVITRGKRSMSSRAYTIRGRAEFDCAECNHVLNGYTKPNPSTYKMDSN